MRHDTGQEHDAEYVTVTIGSQLFGLPIAQVHDVFVPGRLTQVPLAAEEIAGLLNLRGRIVTAIDMRRSLGLPARASNEESMAVGVDHGGESCGLIVDSVGEVLRLDDENREPIPVNLDNRLSRVAAGVYRLENRLLVILDVNLVLDLKPEIAAA